jgi:hypothetical protein
MNWENVMPGDLMTVRRQDVEQIQLNLEAAEKKVKILGDLAVDWAYADLTNLSGLEYRRGKTRAVCKDLNLFPDHFSKQSTDGEKYNGDDKTSFNHSDWWRLGGEK